MFECVNPRLVYCVFDCVFVCVFLPCFYSMSTNVTLYLHHHGDLTSRPNVRYVGGRIEVIHDFDTDLLSFRDFEEFAEKYGYDASSIVCFKTNGKDFSDGFSVVYDDKTVRHVVKLNEPFGRIELYVDHFTVDAMCDVPKTPTNEADIVQKSDDNDNILDYEEYSEESDDADYDVGSDTCTEDSESVSLDHEHPETDEEVDNIREMTRNFKTIMKSSMKGPPCIPDGSEIFSEESEFDSDYLRSDSSTSEDENAKIGYVGPANPRKRSRGKNKNCTREGTIKWEVGQKFVNMDEFRDLVRQYGLEERREVQFVTNDKNRCQVVCATDCSFYIWCSKDKDSENCTIKTLVDEHKCTKPYNNKLATVKHLNELYGERIRKNPQWKVKEMAEAIKKELEIEVSRIKIIRLRKLALEGVHDSLKDHYSRLRDFGHEVLKSNPLNTFKISTTRLNENDQNKFKRVYICYYALKAGWKAGCRPIIGLDGCFLKTVCGGQLLSAVGRDGNNQMFPIAYSIVESENTESWTWFIELLKDDLELENGAGLTIISDQQKGLENAVKRLLPQVEHRFCARHLYSNFRKRYFFLQFQFCLSLLYHKHLHDYILSFTPRFSSLLLRRAFWNAAGATHPVAHAKAMKQLERLSKAAHDHMKQIPAKVWTKAFFGTHCLADNLDNNMSESFNAWIINERFVIYLLLHCIFSCFYIVI